MDDTYKGESLQKKQARWATHVSAQSWLSEHYPGIWEKAAHCFLASREGGDIAALSATGVPFDNMVGFDRNEKALRACAEKWPEPHLVHCQDADNEIGHLTNILHRLKDPTFTSCLSVDGQRVEIPDPNEDWFGQWAMRSGCPSIATVFLDFCCHLDKETLSAAAYTWRAMSYGSVLSVAVLKGREKRQIPKAAPGVHKHNRLARRRLRAISPAQHAISSALRGSSDWDMRSILDMVDEDGSMGPANARAVVIELSLLLSDPTGIPDPLLVLEYQSKTKDSGGVPMLIVSFAKRRQGKRVNLDPVCAKLTQKGAINWRNELLLSEPIERAALILNTSKSTAVAWKAHVTRGTYEKESAA